MKINFKEKPFYLNDNEIEWVEQTLNNMTLDEKIGQLFCILIKDEPVEELIKKMNLLNFKPGSFMSDVFSPEQVKHNFRTLQNNSETPLLFACNLERGGDGICNNGTIVGSQMQVAAAKDNKKWAYITGDICASEASSVGANWNFGPVCDIDYNFHNPIANTRAFSSNPDTVLDLTKEFFQGVKKHSVASCIKHFPGDGRDQRDQHLVTSINDLSVENWDSTYGKIYKTMIDEGIETIMAAQIMLPSYSKKLNPNLEDKDILPASQSYELTTTLLRDILNFNGVVVTDATSMSGYMQSLPRYKALPLSVAAGCDIILFALDMEEDFQFIKDGIKDGIITIDRLNEAVTRILALKAHLKVSKNIDNLSNPLTEKELEMFDSNGTHKNLAKQCAKESITLVKDTQNLLPLNINKHKRILLHVLGDNGGYHDPIKNNAQHLIKLLEKEGFEITLFDNNNKTMLPIGNSVKSICEKYDLILYFCSIKTSGADTVSRITWSTPGGCNTPRYLNEIPTLFISVDNPYMLYDVPTVKTYINGYTPTKHVVEAIIEKIMGRDEFIGISPVDPFCNLFNTRL